MRARALGLGIPLVIALLGAPLVGEAQQAGKTSDRAFVILVTSKARTSSSKLAIHNDR